MAKGKQKEAEKKKRGRPKAIESPEYLLELFNEYVGHIKSNPYKVMDYVGKDAFQVFRDKEKPISLDSFECYLFEKGIINDLGDYFSNKDGRYEEFTTICSYIRKKIKADHIEGGMANIYNTSITQRLNGLVEKQENTVKVEQPLFPD